MVPKPCHVLDVWLTSYSTSRCFDCCAHISTYCSNNVKALMVMFALEEKELEYTYTLKK
jgi:hypothetical protein